MSAVATKPKLLTAEEFCEFVHRPENYDRFFELEDGEITEMPPPMQPHGHVCGNAAWLMGSFVRKRKKGRICTNDTGFVLKRGPDTVRGPDISLYDDQLSLELMPRKYADDPPKLVIEVISPSDNWAKVMHRVTQMLQAGVELIRVIDPEDRTISVHRRGKEPYVLEENDELTGEDVLPDFRCRVADFFAMPGE